MFARFLIHVLFLGLWVATLIYGYTHYNTTPLLIVSLVWGGLWAYLTTERRNRGKTRRR
jgi:hypothetical protein